ncbi:uncharacterized protein [Eucyclogobius newberryi]|uniref:uncharacterized protein n=1 Tax=Eucyclogobius newberryi TaxID=166745 RepID=UPI003B5CF27B
MGLTVEDDGICASSLMVKLNHQRTQAQFCDCVIRKGDGQVYPVHRCILAASSPVLASILYSCGVLVELEAPCLSDCILGYLLDYIYTGTLPHLDYKLYMDLLAAAQYLEMDELQHTIRTKNTDTLENDNTTDEATGFTLIPIRIDKSPEAPLRCSSESKNTCGTHLSSDAKNKEEEVRSHSSVSTEVQQNEQSQVETTPDLCKQGMVKVEEMQSNSGEYKNHNSSSCSTSVIRHSSRVTREDEENVAIKPSHDTEPCTSHTLTDGTSCVIAEEVKTPNRHFDNQDLKYNPSYDNSSCSVNLLKNNEKYSKYCPDKRHRKHSQVQEIVSVSVKNTACNSSVDNVEVAFADEISDTRIKFRNKGTCVKRKLKEENSDKFCKSAKNDLACSASVETEINTDSFYNNEQEAKLENMNAPTTKLYRSLSLPLEGNTCQPAYTDTSYSGQLFYHCESRTSHIPFAANCSPTFADTSSEDNVSIFSTLCQTGTLGAGEVVLLDISSKSSEMLVSYKCTSEMETHATDTAHKIKTDHDKSEDSEGEYQEGNDRLRASSHADGVNVMTTSFTRCTSDCGKECVHNSTLSMSVSDLTPSSCVQKNTSDPSSPAHHAFRCSLCERSFSQRGSLNRHVRSHFGVRPFPCPRCPMSFSRQYRVAEHMRVHQRSALETDFPKPPASSV